MEAHADAEQYPLIPQGESVAVIDLALLEGNIADWPQIRALLTAYISQHLQRASIATRSLCMSRSRSPHSPKTDGKVFAPLQSPGTLSKEEGTWEMLGRPAGGLCYVCALYTKRGELVGARRGAREVARDKDVHKAIKMA